MSAHYVASGFYCVGLSYFTVRSRDGRRGIRGLVRGGHSDIRIVTLEA